MGQRAGIERIAWGLVHLYARAERLGLARQVRVRLPYTQQDLADAVGRSLVPTNKTLRRLRERQIAGWPGGTLTIHDRSRLAELAQYDGPGNTARPLI